MRALVGLTLLLAACGGGDKKKGSPVIHPDGAWQRTLPFEGKSTNGGILAVEFDVKPGETAFQVTGSSRTELVGLERVIDPSGAVVARWQDWLDNDEALSDAFFGSYRTMTFNWPVRAEDGPLDPGSWTVELYSTGNNYNPKNSKIAGTVWLKQDDDFANGQVPVHIVYANGTETNKVTTAVEQAVDEWKRIWGDAGLTLDPTYHSSDLPKNLDFANNTHGSEEVKSYVSTLPPGELVLIVGETVDNEPDTFGLAGGIPGPLEASPFTWVLVGWLTNAGTNGKFSAQEIRIMGETMAHEVGHFSGLYHPIDFDYDFEVVQSWDALADTERCVGWEECEAAMADNVMYPYPVCDYYGNGGCIAANKVTRDQGGVWHRYLGGK